jgi:hypothetical protein
MSTALRPRDAVVKIHRVRRSQHGQADNRGSPAMHVLAATFKRFFHLRKPIGFPLGQHIPADAADHAADFANRYAEPLDWQAAIRMEELGIPRDRIGSDDHLHRLSGCAFNPYERDGGGNGPGGRVNFSSARLISASSNRCL